MIQIPVIFAEIVIITLCVTFLVTVFTVIYKAIEYYKTPNEDVKESKRYNNKNS